MRIGGCRSGAGRRCCRPIPSVETERPQRSSGTLAQANVLSLLCRHWLVRLCPRECERFDSWYGRLEMATAPSPDNPLAGSCLCGGVRFEVSAPFLWANHCYCSRCRKHSGAFGGTQGRVPREGFRLLAGEELISVFTPKMDA